jgi:hypothetical protein
MGGAILSWRNYTSALILKPVLLDLLNFTQAAQQTLITQLDDTEREAPGTPFMATGLPLW